MYNELLMGRCLPVNTAGVHRIEAPTCYAGRDPGEEASFCLATKHVSASQDEQKPGRQRDLDS